MKFTIIELEALALQPELRKLNEMSAGDLMTLYIEVPNHPDAYAHRRPRRRVVYAGGWFTEIHEGRRGLAQRRDGFTRYVKESLDSLGREIRANKAREKEDAERAYWNARGIVTGTTCVTETFGA